MIKLILLFSLLMVDVLYLHAQPKNPKMPSDLFNNPYNTIICFSIVALILYVVFNNNSDDSNDDNDYYDLF